MIKQQKLEDVILESIPYLKSTNTGWYVCRCPICSDYKERGGFKFDSGKVGYSCFNCGRKANYEEFSGDITRNMRNVLHAFNISDSIINAVIGSGFFFKKNESEKITLDSMQRINTSTPPVGLPIDSFLLGSTNDHLDQQQKIVEYLLERHVDLDQYSFYFSTSARMKNRVIIPFYRSGQIIYWQARSIDVNEKKRYDNSAVSREAVMFNMDELFIHRPTPLLVFEGVFDAMMYNGIATLGSTFSDAKLELLFKSNRRLIFVIDKDKNGAHLARSVLKAGWEITFPPDGAKDVNIAIQRFGKIWTAAQLVKNIPADFASADLAIKFNCKV